MEKTLRYLLIVMVLSVASLAFATAQSLAQKPEVQMQSTSGMVGSGSALPQAAAEGTYVTGSTIGTYSPANSTSNGAHRAKKGWGGEGEPGDRPEPWETPLGDAAWLLILAAAVYGVYKRKLRVR